MGVDVETVKEGDGKSFEKFQLNNKLYKEFQILSFFSLLLNFFIFFFVGCFCLSYTFFKATLIRKRVKRSKSIIPER